jgi:transcriptional regulator with XRE-family HTH domain|tara:strand:- start:5113 stop:5976 length:864 start_codon:yes stop_codon:yes gene_type:complete
MDSQERIFRVETFRQRLMEVMSGMGIKSSGLAQAIGVDRSTLSQLLAEENDRLPRVDTLMAIASKLQVSVDWLLGLTGESRSGAEILSQSLQLTPSSPLPSGASLRLWHKEAMGTKIRYVPANLPDFVKTEAVLGCEYGQFESVSLDQVMDTTKERYQELQQPGCDMEICLSVQEMVGFAKGEGLWCSLSLEDRCKQLEWFSQLVDQLYPKLRVYLFNESRNYASPYTIFGAKRSAVYMGHMYFVFNTSEHVQTLTGHFDGLIRAAEVQAHQLKDWIEDLLNEIKEQ